MSNENDRAAIVARRSELERAFNESDLDRLNSLVTDDVIWSTASQPAWIGRQEVLLNIGRFFDGYEYELRFDIPRIDTDGSRAIDRTNFESRVLTTAGPADEPHRGSVFVIWKRDDDWRVAAYLDLGARLFH